MIPGYAALWEWKVSHFLSVPVDPKMEFRWEIEKDYGYYQRLAVFGELLAVGNEDLRISQGYLHPSGVY